MFTARLTSRWNSPQVEPVTLGTFRTGGEASKAVKAALAADDKWAEGEVFSHHYGVVLFSHRSPCPDWVY
jgi:hypothetical protein